MDRLLEEETTPPREERKEGEYKTQNKDKKRPVHEVVARRYVCFVRRIGIRHTHCVQQFPGKGSPDERIKRRQMLDFGITPFFWKEGKKKGTKGQQTRDSVRWKPLTKDKSRSALSFCCHEAGRSAPVTCLHLSNRIGGTSASPLGTLVFHRRRHVSPT